MDDPRPAQRARERLVQEVFARDPNLDDRLREVLVRVPRHLFTPGAAYEDAYANQALPIGHGQTISQPTVVAIMTSALELTGTETVLEVGTGSGYQTAILAELAAHVYSAEVVDALARAASERLRRLGYANVEVASGDGADVWRSHAPFDRILVTAAARELPRAFLDQLAPDGILVAPVGSGDQWLKAWKRSGASISSQAICPVRFVPLVVTTG